MCLYVNMRFAGCSHPRTVVLYKCDSNPNKACPASCFRPLAHPDDCVDTPNKCPECGPSPSTAPVRSPGLYFNNSFRGTCADLILRGQWISYGEMNMAFSTLFHWDMPAVPTDRLFNEKGKASSKLTPLKREMIQKLDTVGIHTRAPLALVHTPIWFR